MVGAHRTPDPWNEFEFFSVGLRDDSAGEDGVNGMPETFHLWPERRGRSYVHLHEVACPTNLTVDGISTRARTEAKLDKVACVSMECICPSYRQRDGSKTLHLGEDIPGRPNDAENLPGRAKLMAEVTLMMNAKGLSQEAVCGNTVMSME